MERERVMLKLADILKDLYNGATFTVSLHSVNDLELIKAAALPIMGPLWIGVDIKKERYLLKRDMHEDYRKHPDRWY